MKKILIATGGSGGHVIPALSIYDHLKNIFSTSIITDVRGTKFINSEKYSYDLIDVPNLFSKIYLFPVNIIKFIFSIFRSYFYLKKNHINIVISTGGYMCLPLCIAAKSLNIKIILFEPNSVLGRTNRLMLNFSNKIICYDGDLKLIPEKYNKKIFIIDRILKKDIYLLKKNNKKEFGKLKKILVVAGSQGAEFFDYKITDLILNISNKIDLEVCQQVFDINNKLLIEKKYKSLGIKFNLFKFDENLSQKIYDYDLAITRSGASSISELSYLNIPFLAIPFPYATDNHQFFNAKYYEAKNSCWIINQNDFDVFKVENLIINLFEKKIDYFKKKENLEKISNQNTWNNVNKKLIGLINENKFG